MRIRYYAQTRTAWDAPGTCTFRNSIHSSRGRTTPSVQTAGAGAAASVDLACAVTRARSSRTWSQLRGNYVACLATTVTKTVRPSSNGIWVVWPSFQGGRRAILDTGAERTDESGSSVADVFTGADMGGTAVGAPALPAGTAQYAQKMQALVECGPRVLRL